MNTIILLIHIIAILVTLYLTFLFWKKANNEKKLLKEINHHFIESFKDMSIPFTFIYTPLKNIYDNACPENIKSELVIAIRRIELMRRNLTRLIGLRNLHSHSANLNIAEFELWDFIQCKLHPLHHLASEKHIKLEVNATFERASVWIDPNMVCTAIDEFIRKAIHHAKPDATIGITVSVKENHWEITVNNPGDGKLTNMYKRNHSFLFNKLIALCNGKILMNFAMNSVTLKFPIKFPQPTEGVQPELCIPETTSDKLADLLFNKKRCLRKYNKPVVVVVESNDEFRTYLEICLSEEYNVISFKEGNEALTAIHKEHPDLVLCNSKLSGMSGVQLSSRLKTSYKTGDIPVILLCPHIEMDKYYERKASLADIFKYSPYNMKELKTDIAVLIANNRTLQKSFLQNLFGENFFHTAANNILQTEHLEFIFKVKDFIVENLEQNIIRDDIASHLCMSSSAFYHKWVSITGEAPKSFIERIKMEKSKELLETGNYKVYEIPELIGLSSLKHFRERFKKYFGILPTEAIPRNNTKVDLKNITI